MGFNYPGTFQDNCLSDPLPNDHYNSGHSTSWKNGVPPISSLLLPSIFSHKLPFQSTKPKLCSQLLILASLFDCSRLTSTSSIQQHQLGHHHLQKASNQLVSTYNQLSLSLNQSFHSSSLSLSNQAFRISSFAKIIKLVFALICYFLVLFAYSFRLSAHIGHSWCNEVLGGDRLDCHGRAHKISIYGRNWWRICLV